MTVEQPPHTPDPEILAALNARAYAASGSVGPAATGLSRTHIPAVSAAAKPRFQSDSFRRAAADTYSAAHDSQLYHDVRPGYPAEIVAEAIAEAEDARQSTTLTTSPLTIADIGAGTGKLTAALAQTAPEATLHAVDPSETMLQQLEATCPEATTHVGIAEDLSMLEDHSVDLLTCAQTWHWVDEAQATQEFARVLAPHGTVLLIWNTLDVRHPWVHRLSRIMHSGDILAPGFVPNVGKQLKITGEIRNNWVDLRTPEELLELARTRSYWIKANEKTRRKVADNLHWYLYEHLGFTPHQPVELPYRCDAFLLKHVS